MIDHEELARDDLRRMVQDVKTLHTRLILIEQMLPEAPEESSLADFAIHPEGAAGLRIGVQVLLRDHVEPLLRALQEVLGT